jgi:hypothetical protein
MDSDGCVYTTPPAGSPALHISMSDLPKSAPPIEFAADGHTTPQAPLGRWSRAERRGSAGLVAWNASSVMRIRSSGRWSKKLKTKSRASMS